MEKLVVVYKLIEGFETMFGFFKDIKNEIATVKGRLLAIENQLEALFHKAPEAAKTEVAEAVTEVKDAEQKL